MKTVYFDESGFTGYNLLDFNAPFYVLASTSINEAEAETILKDTFPKYQQAKEFKSSNIFKSKENKERIVNILTNIDKSKIYFHISHKEFCVFAKMIDYLIEPIVHDGGSDFYKDGFAYKYANFLYFGFKKYLQNDLFTGILCTYLTFSRQPSHDNLNKLKKIFKENLDKVSPYIHEPFNLFYIGASKFEYFNDLDKFKKSNDIYIASVFNSIIYWQNKCKNDLVIVHDNSSHFERQQKLWENITSPNKHEKEIEIGLHKINFPLNVQKTSFTKSEDNYSVQLCDVLAGIMNKCCPFLFSPLSKHTSTLHKYDVDKILGAGLKDICVTSLCFKEEFPDTNCKQIINNKDCIDRISEILFE